MDDLVARCIWDGSVREFIYPVDIRAYLSCQARKCIPLGRRQRVSCVSPLEVVLWCGAPGKLEYTLDIRRFASATAQVKVYMLTIVVNELVRVLQAPESLLDEVRLQVVVAVQRNRDEGGVWVSKNALPTNEPLALSVLPGHRVALRGRRRFRHCRRETRGGRRWRGKDEAR